MRTTRRYFGCCTNRMISTTMVFSIFALVTLPVSTVRSPRVSAVAACVSVAILCLPQFLGAQQRLYPRQIFFRFAQPLQGFRLASGQLKAEPENLLRQLLVLRFELFPARLADFLNATRHDQNPPARETNRVGMGSLCAANPSASLAVASSIPAISNKIRPGFTTETQRSGAPLPLPMRVSAGFLVNGLSGKMRIHNFPPPLMNLVMATREASICRSVIQAFSSAFNPYSPNDKSPPRQALPLRRPRICFLYFTFFGINIVLFSLPLFPPRYATAAAVSRGFGAPPPPGMFSPR